VHNEFNKIDIPALFQIMHPTQYEHIARIPASTGSKQELFNRLKEMIVTNSVFTTQEKREHKQLLKSIRNKFMAISFNSHPTLPEANAILDYVARQSPAFQKNYLAAFIDQSVFAYALRPGQPPIVRLSSEPNNTTASCPDGIRERLLISLRDGGFGLPENAEYQQLAAIIGNEGTFKDEILLHSISQCFTSNNEQLDDSTKTLDEKRAILTSCVMEWLRTNHGYSSDTPPANLQRLIESVDDMLTGGGRRVHTRPRTRARTRCVQKRKNKKSQIHSKKRKTIKRSRGKTH
jgi:hypothetical protein